MTNIHLEKRKQMILTAATVAALFVTSIHVVQMLKGNYVPEQKPNSNRMSLVQNYDKKFSVECQVGVPCPRPNMPLGSPNIVEEKSLENSKNQYPNPTPN